MLNTVLGALLPMVVTFVFGFIAERHHDLGRHAKKMDPTKIVSSEAEVFQLAFDFAGGGLYGVDKVIRTKERAVHSLPYLISVALIDGDVTPAQFKPERSANPAVQPLLKSVSTRPNHELTAQYARKMPTKIAVRFQDGAVIEHEVQDCPGLASRPFIWEQSVEKFEGLVVGRVDAGLRREIKDAVLSLERIEARDLVNLLRHAKAPGMEARDVGRILFRKETA